MLTQKDIAALKEYTATDEFKNLPESMRKAIEESMKKAEEAFEKVTDFKDDERFKDATTGESRFDSEYIDALTAETAQGFVKQLEKTLDAGGADAALALNDSLNRMLGENDLSQSEITTVFSTLNGMDWNNM
jgi:hypothetical protein